jgi:hypothetical protein
VESISGKLKEVQTDLEGKIEVREYFNVCLALNCLYFLFHYAVVAGMPATGLL